MAKGSKFFMAAIFATALGLGVLPGCGSSSSTDGVSGTFSGTGVGMGGKDKPVTVEITLDKGEITDVKATGEAETPGIGTKALENLPEEMKAKKSIAVDTISGSTITSQAILEAAEAALTSAGVNPEDYKK